MPFSTIESAKHIVLVVHKHPDADSLGSACAFYSYLLRGQKKITLFSATSAINPNLAFLPWYEKITDRFPADADCLITFDCGSRSRMGVESPAVLINFDHHRSNDAFGDFNIINPDAISTTEVVYDFFVANDIKINAKMALSLYAGLLEDSRCFGAPECNAKTFAMAHALNGLGAEHALCVEWLYRRRSLASMRIRGVLLKEMKLLMDGRLALFEIKASLLEETGATIAECKLVLDEALEMRTVKAALMYLEHPSGGLKISFRTDGSIDASKVMKEYGGGGHRNRSGARITDNNPGICVDEMMMTIKKEME